MSGLVEIGNIGAAAHRDFERMKSEESDREKRLRHRILLFLNVLALALGTSAGPLLIRFYFLHGGSSRWLSSWVETAGWPLLLLPLYLSYRKQPERQKHITPKLFLACCGIGILTGADDYLYAYGLSFLPLSTSAVLIASQLGFNAVFALLLVRQKFSPFSLNSVVLLTASSVLLAFHTSNDRPEGVTNRQYVMGFVLTMGAAALYGFIIPFIELTYKRTEHPITYMLVMEMQFIMSVSATVFCTVGMLISRDFQSLQREAERFRLGKIDYSMALVWATVAWQLFYIGVFGVTSLANSLLSGVIIAVMIPVTEVLAVVLFHEQFSAEKGMALVLALWGFASYLYGEYYRSLKLRASKVPKQQNKPEGPARVAHGHGLGQDQWRTRAQCIDDIEELAGVDS